MAQWHRSPRLWLALILAAVVVAAVALWVRGVHTVSVRSPLPTPAAREASPLSTPTPGDTTPPSSWTNSGAVLLWVAMGLLLALGIAIVILRWYRHTA
jgi:hypothetical protein